MLWQLPKLGLVMKAAYVTNLARQVDANFNINTPDPGPGTPLSRRPLRNILPNVVNATFGDTTGVGNYHSLQITAERRFTRGLAWLGAYTYSHSIDNVPTQQGGGSGSFFRHSRLAQPGENGRFEQASDIRQSPVTGRPQAAMLVYRSLALSPRAVASSVAARSGPSG